MMGGKTEINKDGFRMTDMEIAVWLRRETGPHMGTSGSEVFLAKTRMDLRVLSWFVKLAKKSFFKRRFTTSSFIKRRF